MNRFASAVVAALCIPLALTAAGCQKKASDSAPAKAGKVAAKAETPAENTSADAGNAEPKAGADAKTVTPEEGSDGAVSRKVHTDPQARDKFNRAAARLNLPLFWKSDANGNGMVDEDELAHLLFYPEGGRNYEASGGALNHAALRRDIALAESWMDAPAFPEGLSADELKRRQLVVKELDQSQPILVYDDFHLHSTEAVREFFEAMLDAAANVDALYAMQTGMAELAADVPAQDPSSQSLFRRNWGPRCLSPLTEHDPDCHAIPSKKPLKVGLYPKDMQDKDAAFCKAIESDPALSGPFTVVRETRGEDGKATLSAVPYNEAWPNRMEQAAKWLEEAARALGKMKGAEALKKDGISDETPLQNYLNAAAKAFRTNDWTPADEAWAAMNDANSRWYVRVGPDEVYWEPCSLKAGFHMTFALISPAGLSWKQKLTPRRQQMEEEMAAMAGAPYAARQVSFQLPDFINIVFNAGDDRDPMGATIGQSLPNWGPVANEGRGRTVAMSNLYTDPDSLRNRRDGAASLFDAETMKSYTDSSEPGLLSTILHEASHNLGPAHEYKVDGKVDNEVFGGALASTAEELKAQTAALWYIEMLLREKVITEAEAREDYVDAITWAFGHISRGMFDGSGRPKHYSQLAAIQVGFLLSEGAMTFDPEAMASNGRDKGAFTIHFDKMPAAVAKLMKIVAGLKARGDRAAMEALVARHVTGDSVPQALVTERMLRYPKASFVYSVETFAEGR